jgi:hypothetical protein
VGVNAASSTGEDVVAVRASDWAAVAWGYFGAGWVVVFGHDELERS